MQAEEQHPSISHPASSKKQKEGSSQLCCSLCFLLARTTRYLFLNQNNQQCHHENRSEAMIQTSGGNERNQRERYLSITATKIAE